MGTDDPYTDDPSDQRAGDRYEDDPNSMFPYLGWPPTYFGTEPEEESARPAESPSREDEGGWLDEGVITLLLVGGVVLFVIPEPATSTIGIFLIIFGVVAWLVDVFTPTT